MALTVLELWPCTGTGPQQDCHEISRDTALTQRLRTDEVLTVRDGLPHCCGVAEVKIDAENYSCSFALADMHSCG